MLQAARPDEDIPADPLGIARIARVTALDLAAATCTVALGDPDDEHGEIASPALRWLAPRAGALRVWSPPAVGEQVLLICPEGDLAQAVVLGGLWWDNYPAPANGDILLALFGDDGRFEYDPAAHACTIDLPAGATLAVTADGGITLTGPVAIEGDVTVSGTLDVQGQITSPADVLGGGKSLKTHRHTGVQAGGAVSGAPQ